MKKAIFVGLLTAITFFGVNAQTVGWLGTSAKTLKNEINKVFELEEEAIKQEILNFEQSNNWMKKPGYLDEISPLEEQELMRKFQVIRNEDLLLKESLIIPLEDWMLDSKYWELLDDSDYIKEDTMLFEDWMVDDDYWKICNPVDVECLRIEAWMFNARYFAIR